MNDPGSIPQEHVTDKISRSLVYPEIEGGIHLADLPQGVYLEIETQNHLYSIVKSGNGMVSICGHPHYCPDPIEVHLAGSSGGGSPLKSSYIGRGMRLYFWHPSHDLVKTSRIREIRQRC